MQLTEKQLQEFKDIYYKEFGKEISDKEALEGGTKLVNLMKILLLGDKNKD